MPAVSSPFSPQQLLVQLEQEHDQEAFVVRAVSVDQLIDTKSHFVMEKARLQSLADANPAVRERCESLIKTLTEHIETLQTQMDRDLQGLLYGLLKSPSRSMDNVPG